LDIDGFSEHFDGFSIGSNDLTQLVLGVDRDSGDLATIFDEENVAVKSAIRQAIQGAHRHGLPVGLCGQAPSDKPEFAAFLVEQGIDSISLTPDAVMRAVAIVAKAEENLRIDDELHHLRDEISSVLQAESMAATDQAVTAA
jgi:pyruvate, water dikinase